MVPGFAAGRPVVELHGRDLGRLPLTWVERRLPSWLAVREREAFSAAGFLVHTPLGPRKSGMPESVEIPAPDSTTTRSAPGRSSPSANTRPTSASTPSIGRKRTPTEAARVRDEQRFILAGFEELDDHVETDNDLPYEESFGQSEGLSDAPFEGPANNGTIDNILALVPSSRIGNKSVK